MQKLNWRNLSAIFTAFLCPKELWIEVERNTQSNHTKQAHKTKTPLEFKTKTKQDTFIIFCSNKSGMKTYLWWAEGWAIHLLLGSDHLAQWWAIGLLPSQSITGGNRKSQLSTSIERGTCCTLRGLFLHTLTLKQEVAPCPHNSIFLITLGYSERFHS